MHRWSQIHCSPVYQCWGQLTHSLFVIGEVQSFSFNLHIKMHFVCTTLCNCWFVCFLKVQFLTANRANLVSVCFSNVRQIFSQWIRDTTATSALILICGTWNITLPSFSLSSPLPPSFPLHLSLLPLVVWDSFSPLHCCLPSVSLSGNKREGRRWRGEGR